MNKLLKLFLLLLLIVTSGKSIALELSQLSEVEHHLMLSFHVYELSGRVRELGLNPKVELEYDEYTLSNEHPTLGGNWLEGSSWTVEKYFDDRLSGFTAAVYKDTVASKYVVAFGGTTAGEGYGEGAFTHANDILQDINLINKAASIRQFHAASRVIRFYKMLAQAEGYELEFTGHSLGGALAQFAGIDTGKNTVTFNTAPMSLSGEVYQLYSDEGKVRAKPSSNHSNIKNIRSANDILTFLVQAIDLIPQVNNDIGLKPLYGSLVSLSDVYSGHKLAPLLGQYKPEMAMYLGDTGTVTDVWNAYTLFVNSAAKLVVKVNGATYETSVQVTQAFYEQIKTTGKEILKVTIEGVRLSHYASDVISGAFRSLSLTTLHGAQNFAHELANDGFNLNMFNSALLVQLTEVLTETTLNGVITNLQGDSVKRQLMNMKLGDYLQGLDEGFDKNLFSVEIELNKIRNNEALSWAEKLDQAGVLLESGFNFLSMGIGAYDLGQNIGKMFDGNGTWDSRAVAGLQSASNLIEIATSATVIASHIPKSAWASSLSSTKLSTAVRGKAVQGVATIIMLAQIEAEIYAHYRNKQIDDIKTSFLKTHSTRLLSRAEVVKRLIDLYINKKRSGLSVGNTDILSAIDKYPRVRNQLGNMVHIRDLYLSRINNSGYLQANYSIDHFSKLNSLQYIYVAIDALSELSFYEDDNFVRDSQTAVTNGFNWNDVLVGAFQGSGAYKVFDLDDLKRKTVYCLVTGCNVFQYYQDYYRMIFNGDVADHLLVQAGNVGKNFLEIEANADAEKIVATTVDISREQSSEVVYARSGEVAKNILELATSSNAGPDLIPARHAFNALAGDSITIKTIVGTDAATGVAQCWMNAPSNQFIGFQFQTYRVWLKNLSTGEVVPVNATRSENCQELTFAVPNGGGWELVKYDSLYVDPNNQTRVLGGDFSRFNQLVVGGGILPPPAELTTPVLTDVSRDFVSIGADILFDPMTGLEWQNTALENEFSTSNTFSASEYCNGLDWNGKSDWRFPGKRDILTLIDYSRQGVDGIHPKFNSSENYFVNDSTLAETVINFRLVAYFEDVNVTSNVGVRCVRGENRFFGPSSRFVRSLDGGVIKDELTGLHWSDPDIGSRIIGTWQQGFDLCANLDYSGFQDWRLPNVNELFYSYYLSPAQNKTAGSFRWTSTNALPNEFVPDGDVVFAVYNGDIARAQKSQSTDIQCVRGGAEVVPADPVSVKSVTMRSQEIADYSIQFHPNIQRWSFLNSGEEIVGAKAQILNNDPGMGIGQTEVVIGTISFNTPFEVALPFSPTHGQFATQQVTLQIIDDSGNTIPINNSANNTFGLTVRTNHPPQFDPNQPLQLSGLFNTDLTLTLKATDLDGDPLSYSIEPTMGVSLVGNVLTANFNDGVIHHPVIISVSDGIETTSAQLDVLTFTPSNVLDIYADVDGLGIYDNFISYATLKGLVLGNAESGVRNFYPNEAPSWPELLKMVANAAVEAGAVSVPVDNWLKAPGLVPPWVDKYYTIARMVGAVDSNLDLNASPTNQDVARLLVRFLALDRAVAGLNVSAELALFSAPLCGGAVVDNCFSDEQARYEAQLVNLHGLFMRDTAMNPQGLVSRAQIAEVISRMLLMPSATIQLSAQAVEYGGTLTLNLANIKAPVIKNNELFVVSDADQPDPINHLIVDYVVIDDQVVMPPSKLMANFTPILIDSTVFGVGLHTAYIKLENSKNGVYAFQRIVFDVGFSDGDFDGIQDSVDLWPDNASYSTDQNNNGIPDFADQIWNLHLADATIPVMIDGQRTGYSYGEAIAGSLAFDWADDDFDGVPDLDDAFPLDSTEWNDNDNDGIGDNADPDDDNDGIPDVQEAINGTDPLVANNPPPSGANLTPPNIAGLRAVSPTSVGVIWAQTENASFFRLYRSTDGSIGFQQVYAGAGMGFNDSGLTPNTLYYYKVKGCADANEASCSAFSSAGPVTTPSQGVPADLVSEFTLSSTTLAQGGDLRLNATVANPGGLAFDDRFQFAFALSADTLLDATDTALFRSGASSFSFPPATQQSFAYTYQAPANLAPGNHYLLACMVYVEAQGSAATSYCASQTVVVTEAPAAPPPAPTAPLLSYTQGETSVGIGWNGLSGGRFYRLFRADNSAGPLSEIFAGSGFAFTDSALVIGQQYFYQLKSCQNNLENSCSEYSPASSVRITNAASHDFFADKLKLKQSGSQLTITATQNYSGTGTTFNHVNLGFYLSVDDICSTASDLFLAEAQSGLKTTDTFDVEEVTVSLPPQATTGVWYICAIADHDNRFNETDETNNAGAIVAKTEVPTPTLTTHQIGLGRGHITVNWTPVAGTVSYRLYRFTGGNTDINLANLVYEGTGSNIGFSHEDINDLTQCGQYSYQVLSCNGITEAALCSASPIVSGYTLPTKAPTPSVKALGTDKIKVSWPATTCAEKFYVARTNGSNRNYVYYGDGDHFMDQTEIIAGQQYSYDMGYCTSEDASFGQVCSAASNLVSVTPLAINDDPFWTPQGVFSPLQGRVGTTVIEFRNKLWLFGGQKDGVDFNDVWSSDDGLNWNLVTDAAGFSPRTFANVAVLNDQIFLIGGRNPDQSLSNDIWSSSDGVQWVSEAVAAPFEPRNSATTTLTAFNNELWLIGGQGGISNTAQADIWRSSNGRDWTLVTSSAPFLNRSRHAAYVHDGKLWISGGDGKPGSTRSWDDMHADIWSSSDGSTWIQENGTAEFGARMRHDIVKLGGKLWMIGGQKKVAYRVNPNPVTYSYAGIYDREIWSSIDGRSWHQESEITKLPKSVLRSVAFNNQLIAGQPGSDRWTATYNYLPVPPTGNVAISGAPVTGSILFAETSSVFDPQGKFGVTYQWYVDNEMVPGEETSTFQLAGVAAGNRVKVRVQFKNALGDLQTVFSEEIVVEVNPVSANKFDFDGDQVSDGVDNCPTVMNADQLDTDGDGLGDVCDLDRDGDGVVNVADDFPLLSTEWSDTDRDGVGDNADLDDDNDGISDIQEEINGTNPLVADNAPVSTKELIVFGKEIYRSIHFESKDYVEIAVGDNHSLGLKQNGTVVAWGDNSYGQSEVPNGLSGVTSIAAGRRHSVALKEDGTVVVWGASAIPVGLSDVIAISAWGGHTLALKRNGTVEGWGDVGVPSNLSGVVAISTGERHSLALKQDGTVFAWGANISGQMNVPVGLNDVIAISAGGSHSIALKQDGTVVCWGANDAGQTDTPANLTGVTAISAGVYHSIAIKQDGTSVVWGGVGYGITTIPDGLTGVKSVAMGQEHTVAMMQNGSLESWGVNDLSQAELPIGSSGIIAIASGETHTIVLRNDGTVGAWGISGMGQTNVPVGLADVVSITAGRSHSVALKRNGSVVAWGGRTDLGVSDVPDGLEGVISVAAGSDHTLALRQDGTVIGWGANNAGQTDVPNGMEQVIAIAAGEWHSLALKEDGTVVGWGGNDFGQSSPPTGLSGVVAISASSSHSIALKSDGTVVAWGNNVDGQTEVPAGLSEVVAISTKFAHNVALKQDGTVVSWGYNGNGQIDVPIGLSGATLIATGWSNTLVFGEIENVDIDGDGVANSLDNCPDDINAEQLDWDGDGLGDVCDNDMDNDGFVNLSDAFPLDMSEWNDNDYDGIGDNTDPDDDNDGISDADESLNGSDPLVANYYTGPIDDGSIVVHQLVTGFVHFSDRQDNVIPVPGNAWVGILPSQFATNAAGFNRLTCPIDSNGTFGQNCYIEFDEEGIRQAFADSSETFQLVIFQNHVEPSGSRWNCGENLYRFVGENSLFGDWADIQVTPTDFQDRSDELCDESPSTQTSPQVTSNTVVVPDALISPNGSENWFSGITQQVIWNNQLITGQFVDLYVLHDDPSSLLNPSNQQNLGKVINDRNWHMFASSVPNTGSYSVDPSDLRGGGNAYMVLIVSTQNRSIYDISNSPFGLNHAGSDFPSFFSGGGQSNNDDGGGGSMMMRELLSLVLLMLVIFVIHRKRQRYEKLKERRIR